jgi:hypothetical protein
VRKFSSKVIVPGTPARARAVALDKLGSALDKSGYELAEQTPNALTFNRKSSFLLSKKITGTITMTFKEAAGGKTEMVVAGMAPRRIAQEFEGLAR